MASNTALRRSNTFLPKSSTLSEARERERGWSGTRTTVSPGCSNSVSAGENVKGRRYEAHCSFASSGQESVSELEGVQVGDGGKNDTR
jgi:hypothetical protein